MKWILLVAVILGIGWTANWSYHQLDQAVLITDYFQATTLPQQWALVDFSQEKPVPYHYTATSGYWEIAKGLWPIWALFSLLTIGLIPLTVYLYQSLSNQQIIAARHAQTKAENRASKAESDAKAYEERAKAWAEEKVNNAYQEQLSRVRKELEQEWDNYHQLKNQLVQRENCIHNKEANAQKIQKDAQALINELKEKYALELSRFEAEIAKLTAARDNAQAGYQRLKIRTSPKQKQP